MPGCKQSLLLSPVILYKVKEICVINLMHTIFVFTYTLTRMQLDSAQGCSKAAFRTGFAVSIDIEYVSTVQGAGVDDFKNMFAHRCQAVEVHDCYNIKLTGTSADIQVWMICRFSEKPLHAQGVGEYDFPLCYCHNHSLRSYIGILTPLASTGKGIT